MFHDELSEVEGDSCFLSIGEACFPREAKILESYSQGGCFFECMLQFAYARCDCLPWNFPRFEISPNQSTHLCDVQGHNCFRRNFYSQATIPSKDQLCPFCAHNPDCEAIKYEAYQTKIRIDNPGEVCGVKHLVGLSFQGNSLSVNFSPVQ